MDRHGTILQLYARAPAPLRDYYGLTINQKEVILNMWNISHGPHVFPKRQKCLLEDFQQDRNITMEVANYFGDHVLEYCLDLSRKDPKLQALPTKLFLYILRYLATNDIVRLGQTSKIFFELCNTNAVWKIIFRKKSRRKLSVEEKNKVEISGWRSLVLDLDIRQNGILSSRKPKTPVNFKGFSSKKKISLASDSNMGAGDFRKSLGKTGFVYKDLQANQETIKYKEISTGALIFGGEMQRLVKDRAKNSQKSFQESQKPIVCKETSNASNSNRKLTKTISNTIPNSQIPNQTRSDYNSIFYKPNLDSTTFSDFKNDSSFTTNFDKAIADATDFFEERCKEVLTDIRSQNRADKEIFQASKNPPKQVKFEIGSNLISNSLNAEKENKKRITNFVTNFQNLNLNDLRFMDENEEIKSVDEMGHLDDGQVNSNPFHVDDFEVEQEAMANLKEAMVTECFDRDLEVKARTLYLEENEVKDVGEDYSGSNLEQPSTFQILDDNKLSLKVEQKPKDDLRKVYANSLTKSRITNYKHGYANRHLFDETQSGSKGFENYRQSEKSNFDLKKKSGSKSNVNLNEFAVSQVELGKSKSEKKILEKYRNTSQLKSKSQSNFKTSNVEKNEVVAKPNQGKSKEQSKSVNKCVRYADEVKIINDSGDCSQTTLAKEDKSSKSFLYSLFGNKSKLEAMNNSKIENDKDLRIKMNNQLNSLKSKSPSIKMIDNFVKERRRNGVTTAASGNSKRINT